MQFKLVTGVTLGLGLAACSSADPQLETTGLYYLESSFATPRGVPEAAAPQLHEFIALADRPESVSTWLLDGIEDELGSPFKDALSVARSSVDADAELQAFLADEAPDMLENITGLAADLREVMSTLNFSSELFLSPVAEDTTSGRITGAATHTVTGVVFRVNGEDYRYDLSELGMSSMGPGVTDYQIHEDDYLSFGLQDYAVPYGQLMNYGLSEVILDARDPFAADMSELVASYVPCARIGDWLNEELELGSDEIYTAACIAAIARAVDELVPAEVPGIVADLRLDTGDAEMINDESSVLAGLTGGLWEGHLSFEGATTRLRRPDHSFFGNRSRARRNGQDDAR